MKCIILIVLCISIYGLSPCINTPFNSLSTCNNTCLQCGQTLQTCLACPFDLELYNSYCRVSQFNNAMVLNEISGDLLSINISRFTIDGKSVSIASRSVTICSPNFYNFKIFGFFTRFQSITYQRTMNVEFSYIEIRMKVITLVESTKISIFGNQGYSYQQTIQSVNLTLNETYDMDTSQSYYSISALNTQSVNTIIQSFNANRATFGQSLIKMIIEGKNPNVNYSSTFMPKIWGIKEFIIIGKVCETCLYIGIGKVTTTIGTALGIVTTLLLIFGFVLIGCTYFTSKCCEKNIDGGRDYLLRNKVIHRMFNKNINSAHNRNVNKLQTQVQMKKTN